MIASESIAINVTYSSKNGYKSVQLSYDRFLCCGEVIRNVCVNLGVDPDTVEGFTRNMSVLHNGKHWDYDPRLSLQQAGISSGDAFELIPTDSA